MILIAHMIMTMCFHLLPQYPSKRETLIQRWFNAGLATQAVFKH